MKTIREFIGNDLRDVYYVENDHCYMYNGQKDSVYYFHPLLSYGDYDNSCEVERANFRVFMEQFGQHADVVNIGGMYGWESIGVKLTCCDPEILETFEALAENTVLDMDVMSEVFCELESEALDNWVLRDIAKAIQVKFLADHVDVIDTDNFIRLFFELKERANAYGQIEAGGIYYIDVEKLTDHVEIEDIGGIIALEYWDIRILWQYGNTVTYGADNGINVASILLDDIEEQYFIHNDTKVFFGPGNNGCLCVYAN